jgi:DNA helicase HerA-like ATPase
MADDTKFYLGRLFDSKLGKVGTDPYLYDPADLTTHAVITGMTGSGKTGFCVSLMEEAALKGIPAISVDPKGDLTNLVLHFPDLLRRILNHGLTLMRLAGKARR